MRPVRLLYGGVAVGIGVVLGWACAARTVRRLHARLAEVEHQASHDPLTGLLNRAGLHQHFTAADRRERLLVLADLDGFKAVNDRFGHAAGDRLLAEFATRLAAAAASRGGLVGRLGGDEFVMLLHPHGHAQGTIPDWLLAALSAAPARFGTGPGLSASAGVTAVAPGVSWSAALRRADIALYHAKGGTRPVAWYRAGMTHPARADAAPSTAPAYTVSDGAATWPADVIDAAEAAGSTDGGGVAVAGPAPVRRADQASPRR
jgi:diguanylate cyclase (GGDEF)-like protein